MKRLGPGRWPSSATLAITLVCLGCNEDEGDDTGRQRANESDAGTPSHAADMGRNDARASDPSTRVDAASAGDDDEHAPAEASEPDSGAGADTVHQDNDQSADAGGEAPD